MSQGEKKCKMYGNCQHEVENCSTGCDFYNPKNPEELLAIPDDIELPDEIKEEKPEVSLVLSNLPKFDKLHEFFVMKRHVFAMQSVSPKKIILKYKRKLKETDKLADGCYIFLNREDELLEPDKVFKQFDRNVKAKAQAKVEEKAIKEATAHA